MRLVTTVELREDGEGRMSLSALHEAVLDNGRRVVLLDDRGWTEEVVGGPSVWAGQTVEEIQRTARVVVGPDEGDVDDAAHWQFLARRLGVSADELRAAPRDVELGERLRARLG